LWEDSFVRDTGLDFRMGIKVADTSEWRVGSLSETTQSQNIIFAHCVVCIYMTLKMASQASSGKIGDLYELKEELGKWVHWSVFW